MLAVSGGADSSALAIALARGLGAGRAEQLLVVGHVLHDLRPATESEHDRACAARLAARLGLRFCSVCVRVRGMPGNVENLARTARYADLRRMALAEGCAFVATAHQADDVLETVIMRLVRGTGVRGLAAIHPARALGEGVTLVRPMLGVDRAASEALCTGEGWVWCEDGTNQSQTLMRSRVRATVLPVLKELSPRVATRAVALTEAARDVGDVMRDAASRVKHERVLGGGIAWRRDELRALLPGLVHEVLTLGAWTMVPRASRRDATRGEVLRRAVRAVRDRREDARLFELGSGLTLRVDATRVVLADAAS